MHSGKKKGLITSVGVLAAVATLLSGGVVAAYAGDTISNPNSAMGYPSFLGDSHPMKYEKGVTYQAQNSYLQKVFDNDVANGAGSDTDHDFWIDRILARTGNQPQRVSNASGFQGPYGWESGVSQAHDANGKATYSYNNPDENKYLFTRGRAVFMYTHKPEVLGFGGNLAYWDVTDKEGYSVTVSTDGQKIDLSEDASQRKQTPSYWKGVFNNADKTLTVTEIKYITNNNVAVTELHLSGTKAMKVVLSATSPLATVAEGNELTGRFAAKNNVTTVYPRFSGNDFAAQDGKLIGSFEVSADAKKTTKTKLQLGLITNEIPESRTEYDAIRDGDRKDPQVSYQRHVTEYNKWWVDNVPYIQTPEENIDKTVIYRWWLSRFNYLDANIPGNVLQYPTSIEGVLGYNNAIDLTIGMFIDDLKWMRDPTWSYGPWISAGETAGSQGQYRDNPADPGNWGASHTQWISEAAWDSYMIHGGPANIAEKFADYASANAKGQFKINGRDTDNDLVIDTNWNAWTGNDADAVSFDEHKGYALDRAESATEWAGAKAAAEAYRLSGNTDKATEMDEFAAKMKASYIKNLWDSKDKLVRHKWVNGPGAGKLAKYKEINNYTPYSVGMMPAEGDADYADDYEAALRLLADADQHPIFPFATANQADDKLVREDGNKPTNNFSIINSDLYFRAYQAAIRKYHANDKDKQYVTPEMYKKLLYWNAFAHYQGGDNRLPDQNEFWNNADTKNGGSIQYRSWIHHTQLGSTNWTLIEDVAGMTSRTDDKIELNPIAMPGWNYFTVNNLNYHGKNVTIVWDKDGSHYGGPAGYSVYIGDQGKDSELAFTVDKLSHVVYDPATGKVEVKDESGAKVTTANKAVLPDATGVTYTATDRVTDLLAKTGTNVDSESKSQVNLAEGKKVEATFQEKSDEHAAKNAVDGSTVNQKFWGTKGTSNATDSLTVDFGKVEDVDDVRLYFYQTSTTATTAGYAEPSMYKLEYLGADGQWKAIENQARTPNVPQANYNRVQFPPVKASKIRVTVTPQTGYAVGLKEIEAYTTGIQAPASANIAPSVDAQVTDERVGQITVSGTVKDDGLPNGTLTAQWSVKQAPEDGEVVFADANATTTTARFSKEGTYVLNLTVSDGELSTSKDLTVQGTVSDGTVNVAPDSQVTASYTNSYLPKDAAKHTIDGKIAYSGSPNTDSWNNWGDPFTENPAWLQYQWNAKMPISKASLYLWADGGGVKYAQSWKLQYADDQGNWRDVKLKTDSAYTVKTDSANTVEFDTVTTDKLRVVFADKSVIGVCEFEAWAEEPLSVDQTAITTQAGKVPDLPKTVNVAYGDGHRADLPVSWPKVDASQLTDGADVKVEGTVVGATKPAKLTIYVRTNNGDTATNQEGLPEQFVYQYTKKASVQLPSTIIVNFNNGAKRHMKVTWNADELSKLDLNALGSTEITGTLPDLPDASFTPKVKVTVVEGRNTAPEPETVDKTALRVIVTRASSVDHGVYTNETLDALDKALADGQRTLANNSATQEDVDSAVKVLDGAIQGLTKLDDVQVQNNLARNAKIKASYTTSWNKLEAVNDGEVSYTATGDSSVDNPKAWGTWSASNPKQQWLEYDWDNEVTLNKATLYFWYDNEKTGTANNVPLPKTFKLQYWDSAKTNWSDVVLSEGAEYDVAKDAGSSVSFEPVTTTKLRAVIDADGDGSKYAAIGVSEFAAYAAQTTPEPQPVPVTKITVTGTALVDGKVTLNKDKSTKLSVSIEPDNATNQQVTWTSSDTAIATVDANGTVTALKAGTAIITATAADGSGTSASATVEVLEPNPDPNPSPNPSPDPDPTPEPDKPTVDDLQAAVKQAESYQQGDYTVASWSVFVTALNRAQALLQSGKTSEEDIASALAALRSAESGLVKVSAASKPEQSGQTGQNSAQKVPSAVASTGSTVYGIVFAAVLLAVLGAVTLMLRLKRGKADD